MSEKYKPRSAQKCQRCRNHGLVVLKRGHKRFCPNRLCTCATCRVTALRQRAIASHAAIIRWQQEDGQRAIVSSSNMDDNSSVQGSRSEMWSMNASPTPADITPSDMSSFAPYPSMQENDNTMESPTTPCLPSPYPNYLRNVSTDVDGLKDTKTEYGEEEDYDTKYSLTSLSNVTTDSFADDPVTKRQPFINEAPPATPPPYPPFSTGGVIPGQEFNIPMQPPLQPYPNYNQNYCLPNRSIPQFVPPYLAVNPAESAAVPAPTTSQFLWMPRRCLPVSPKFDSMEAATAPWPCNNQHTGMSQLPESSCYDGCCYSPLEGNMSTGSASKPSPTTVNQLHWNDNGFEGSVLTNPMPAAIRLANLTTKNEKDSLVSKSTESDEA